MQKRLRHVTLGAAAALVAAAGGFAMTTPHSPAVAGGAADVARCELRVGRSGGSTTLEGFVTSPTAIAGSYRISVVAAGPGGSDVDQSGAFEARPGQRVSLGVVSVGGSQAGYNAEMTVRWNGASTTCTQRIGGRS